MSDAVQQIKDRLNILDVVSPYVELHKSGKNFKGKSPFSAEKTPSFYVSPDRGMYYCFSTSQGGDIFNFVQAMEGVDFKEALKMLAARAGIELVPEQPEKRSERERQYAALEAATAFYQGWLDQAPEAVGYLTRRGVTSETITKWRIGYAPGPPEHGWREAKEHLQSIGYTKDELLRTGLVKGADNGKEPFDTFRDRIMFPLFEPSCKVVAFSGRILHPNEKSPKYVNSPETDLYKKSDLLFGYDKAKQGIRHLGFSLIVEGQFDVVMCHQAGYTNTVAVSGTALTLHHVQLLERLSDKVVLALDADRAGINAMKKAADLMLRRGLDVKVAELPLGKDPADIVLEGVAAFKKIIGHSVHVIEFLLHVLQREYADERTFKRKLREELLPFVLLLPSRIDQEHFEKLIATTTDITREAIRFELEHLRSHVSTEMLREPGADLLESAQFERTADVAQKAYLFLLGAMEVVEDALAHQVKEALMDIHTIVEPTPPTDTELARVTFTLEQQFAALPALTVRDEVVAKLNQYRLYRIRQQLTLLRKELVDAEERHDDERVVIVLQSISEYETKLRQPGFDAESFVHSDH